MHPELHALADLPVRSDLPVHRVPEGTQPSTWTSTLWQYKCLVQPYASRLLAVLLAFMGCCIVWGEMTILSVSGSFASDCQARGPGSSDGIGWMLEHEQA